MGGVGATRVAADCDVAGMAVCAGAWPAISTNDKRTDVRQSFIQSASDVASTIPRNSLRDNRASWESPAHLALLKTFWSSVLLATRSYKGDPMMTHLQLPLEEAHFQRWLALFAE